MELSCCKVHIPQILMVMLFLKSIYSRYAEIMEQFCTRSCSIKTATLDSIVEGIKFHDEFMIHKRKGAKPPGPCAAAAAASAGAAGPQLPASGANNAATAAGAAEDFGGRQQALKESAPGPQEQQAAARPEQAAGVDTCSSCCSCECCFECCCQCYCVCVGAV